MSPVDNVLLRAAYAGETGDAVITLFTITHPLLPQPIRMCNYDISITSRGNVYTAIPFMLTLQREDGGTITGALFTIDNVERTLVQSLRSTAIPFTSVTELIMASEPDVVQRGPWNNILQDITYNSLVIQCNLGVELVLSEPFPGDTYDEGKFPSLY